MCLSSLSDQAAASLPPCETMRCRASLHVRHPSHVLQYWTYSSRMSQVLCESLTTTGGCHALKIIPCDAHPPLTMLSSSKATYIA